MNIAEVCMRRKTVTLALSAALLAAGVAGYFRLGRLEDPEFTIRMAQIVTMWPGASAQEVADSVTDPLETAVQQLGKLEHITSVSSPGRSVITVEIRDKFTKDELPQIWTDLRHKVSDKAGSLPEGCATPTVVDDYGDVYGVLYAIYGDGFTPAGLLDHAKMLRRELLQCPGVAKIDLLGVQQEIVSLEMPRVNLANLAISPDDIAAALKGQNVPEDAGHLRVGDKYLRLSPGGAINDLKAIDDLALNVTDSKGRREIVYLGDIVKVSRDYVDPPTTLVRYNGHPAIAIGISTAKGGNVVKMGEAVEKRMKELLPSTPVGIETGVISHQARSVETAVDGFVMNIVESVLIVVAVLLFTMGMRSGMLIGGVLLLVVMATVAVMDYYGILFERISLGAFIIALGMLVDNAIVVVEAVLVAANRGESKVEAAKNVVKQTQWPLLGATMVAVLSFAPVGGSSDASGEFCRSLFLVIGISLLLSWVLAITVTPLFASVFLKGSSDKSTAVDPYAGRFFRIYRAFLEWCIGHVGLTWMALGLMVFAAIVGFNSVKRNFFPDSTRPQFMVHVRYPQGTSIHVTDEGVQKLTEEVRKLEGVTGVASVTGGGALRFLLSYAPESPNSSYGVLFADVESDELISGLVGQVEAMGPSLLPDAEVACQRFVLGPGEPQKIQYRVMGPEPAVLRDFGEKAQAILRSDGRIKEVQSDWRNRAEVLVPRVNEERARKMGFSRSAIARALRENRQGVTVGAYREGDETLPIVLRPPKAERDDPNALASAWLWNSRMGVSVPFAQLVDGVDNSSEEMQLGRRDRLPCLTVKCNPADGETAAEALARVMPKLDALAAELPAGYRGEWGGEYENSNRANKAVSGKLWPILAVMVMVVLALFNSVRKTLVIFMTLPLIIVGVVAGLLVFDAPFGFMALLGLLSLIGMQVKNAIVLMDEINARLDAGDTPYQAIVSAGVSRVRPVANASLTTILGMLPLVTDAFYSAMAVTIMFGLAFATVLTMVVIPVNYALLFRVRKS